MKTIAIIQARMASSRLPSKVFRRLGALTVIEWVLLRTRRFNFIDQVCLATTCKPEDDAIVKVAKQYGVPCVREGCQLLDGRNDVLARYAVAARMLKADHIVRVTADCPFISPQLAAEVWHRYDFQNYTANVIPELDGFDVEIFPAERLFEMVTNITNMDDRHHITPVLRRTPWTYVAQPQVHGRKLSLDTPQDLAFLEAIAKRVDLYAEWPEIIKAADDIKWEERHGTL